MNKFSISILIALTLSCGGSISSIDFNLQNIISNNSQNDVTDENNENEEEVTEPVIEVETPFTCSTPKLRLLSQLTNNGAGANQSIYSLSQKVFTGTCPSPSNGNIQIIDTSVSPAVELSVAAGDGNCVLDLTANKDHVFGSTQLNTVYSLDISDPINPVTVDTQALDSQGWAIASRGNHLYVGDNGLKIFDITDPSNLILVNDIPYRGFDIQVEENRIYISSNRHIYILNSTDPASPVLLGTIDLGASFTAYELHQTGNYIYTVGKDSRLFRAIDITDPSTPQVVYTSPVDSSQFQSITGKGNFLYVGMRNSEVRIYDIASNPALPSLVDSIASSSRIFEVELVSDTVLATANSDGNTQFFSTCDD